MPSSNRCVFGCNTTGVTIHKFPNPLKYPELFRSWVELASVSLGDMSDDTIYRNRNVCDKHFTETDKNRNNRLNRLAVPRLHLPKTSTSIILEGSSRDTPSTSVLEPQHLSDNSNILIDTDVHTAPEPSVNPCCSLEILQTKDNIMSTDINNDHSYCAKPGHPQSRLLTFQTANNDMLIDATSHTAPEQAVDHSVGISQTEDNITSTAAVMLDHSYCAKPGRFRRLRVASSTGIMQHDLKRLRSEISRLRKRSANYKTRLANAEKLSNHKALLKITDKMSLPAKLFTNIQFRETINKPKGRRFTNDEKILALSLYKRSPKCYSLLSKCFTLPSSKSLRNLLYKIKLTPGINKIIFEKLKHTVADMNEEDRLCTLIFDEMSINPQVHYNAALDEFKGFTTIGKNNITDHVLTFMVRGVRQHFKQPVAYYFTSCLNKTDLKNSIKEVIEQVQSTGLKIVATVCDQSTVNVGALESFVQDAKAIYLKKGLEWRHDVIIVGKNKIIPLYDAPHLLKGIRNNLLTKDLTYVDPEDKKNKIVKWEYFQKLYNADQSYGELKILQKLTEDHINPVRINKMKVKTASQIFSHSVAIAAKHLIDGGKLESECMQLAPFVLMMDKVFDSLNCNTFISVNGKIYRAGVKVNSPHHKLWQDAIIFLKNMKFIEKKKVGNKIILIEKVVPSIKNFIKTLEGMQALWKLLNGKYGFDIMLCRNFNQDPIENFFGSIRSLGVRNIAPNTIAFEAAFKSLLLNNFCSSHSLKANCEDDRGNFLQSIDFLVTASETNEKIEVKKEIVLNDNVLSNCEVNERNAPESYVCGWVLRKCCIKIIKGCVHCKRQLVSNENLFSNAYIKAKEFDQNKAWLCYPSEELKQYFSEVQSITTNMIKGEINTTNVKQNIKALTEIFVNSNVFNCEIHKNELKKYFEDVTINIILYSWCRSVNRILSGKIKYNGDDETKTKAQVYFNKHQHNKTKK